MKQLSFGPKANMNSLLEAAMLDCSITEMIRKWKDAVNQFTLLGMVEYQKTLLGDQNT
jgi:hypothetical protein